MEDKYSFLYKFMFETLGLTREEALENTLKLEGAVSKDVLKRLKQFINFIKENSSNTLTCKQKFMTYCKDKEINIDK